MADNIVKIMVEVLSVLAVTKKQINQGRFSECTITYTFPMAQCAIEKFAKKLLGESEVEAVLQRLDRLTQDDAQMTVLDVAHGFVGTVKVIMEGTRRFHDPLLMLL